MGNDSPVASICGEIDSGADFYDYDAKYITDTSTAYIPARIDEEVEEIVREAAIKVYQAIGCQGHSRPNSCGCRRVCPRAGCKDLLCYWLPRFEPRGLLCYL